MGGDSPRGNCPVDERKSSRLRLNRAYGYPERRNHGRANSTSRGYPPCHHSSLGFGCKLAQVPWYDQEVSAGRKVVLSWASLEFLEGQHTLIQCAPNLSFPYPEAVRCVRRGTEIALHNRTASRLAPVTGLTCQGGDQLVRMRASSCNTDQKPLTLLLEYCNPR